MTHGNTVDPESQRRQSSVSERRLEGLIGACAIGAESAFEQLYELTSSRWFGVLRRIFKTDALAEEALQDIYVNIWNHAHRYESGKSGPGSWLASIAGNHTIDLLRKHHRGVDVALNIDSTIMDFRQDRAMPMDAQQAQLFAVGLEYGDGSAQAVPTGPVLLSGTIVSLSGNSY